MLVPAPITAPVPLLIVKIEDVASVKLPFVNAGSLSLKVFQSVEDKYPLVLAVACDTANSS
jgi:hypothetical protein